MGLWCAVSQIAAAFRLQAATFIELPVVFASRNIMSNHSYDPSSGLASQPLVSDPKFTYSAVPQMDSFEFLSNLLYS